MDKEMQSIVNGFAQSVKSTGNFKTLLLQERMQNLVIVYNARVDMQGAMVVLR